MAQKSTIFRADVSVADIDRSYYRDHVLRVARHPSETDERMMVRILAFALHADDALEFGRGLSTEDEPDLWRRDLTGAIESWIDVGLPDERDVRKACGRAREVHVLAYGGRAADLWWDGARDKLERLAPLQVSEVSAESSRALAGLADRSMQLQVTIQEGHVLVTNGDQSVDVAITQRKARAYCARGDCLRPEPRIAHDEVERRRAGAVRDVDADVQIRTCSRARSGSRRRRCPRSASR